MLQRWSLALARRTHYIPWAAHIFSEAFVGRPKRNRPPTTWARNTSTCDQRPTGSKEDHRAASYWKNELSTTGILDNFGIAVRAPLKTFLSSFASFSLRNIVRRYSW